MKLFVLKNEKYVEFFRPIAFDWCEFSRIQRGTTNIVTRFLIQTMKKSGKSLLRCPLSGKKSIIEAQMQEGWMNIFPTGFYQHEIMLDFPNDNFFMKIIFVIEFLNSF